jgi:hypothetical protein
MAASSSWAETGVRERRSLRYAASNETFSTRPSGSSRTDSSLEAKAVVHAVQPDVVVVVNVSVHQSPCIIER